MFFVISSPVSDLFQKWNVVDFLWFDSSVSFCIVIHSDLQSSHIGYIYCSFETITRLSALAEDAIGKVFFTAWGDGLLVEQLISDPFFSLLIRTNKVYNSFRHNNQYKDIMYSSRIVYIIVYKYVTYRYTCSHWNSLKKTTLFFN